MLDIGLKISAAPFPPHLLTDIEVKVTDLEFFMINEMSISHQSVIRKHSSFKYKNLGGSASIPGYMPWGRVAGQNIEHPHTLAILSSFCLLQMHFSLFARRNSCKLRCPATVLINAWH